MRTGVRERVPTIPLIFSLFPKRSAGFEGPCLCGESGLNTVPMTNIPVKSRSETLHRSQRKDEADIRCLPSIPGFRVREGGGENKGQDALTVGAEKSERK